MFGTLATLLVLSFVVSVIVARIAGGKFGMALVILAAICIVFLGFSGLMPIAIVAAVAILIGGTLGTMFGATWKDRANR